MFVFFDSIILFPRTYPEEIEIHLINYKNIYWKLLIIAKYWEILKFFPIKENLNKAWYTLDNAQSGYPSQFSRVEFVGKCYFFIENLSTLYDIFVSIEKAAKPHK